MNKFSKTIKRMTCLTVCLLMVFSGAGSEDFIPPKETPQAEMEVSMPSIPYVNIGGIVYNVKDKRVDTATIPRGKLTSMDLNAAITPGIYWLEGEFTHYPSDYTNPSACTLVVMDNFAYQSYYVEQFLIYNDGVI